MSPYQQFTQEDMIVRDFLAADRTLLANERTILAYVRTSLTLIIAGVSFIHFIDTPIISALGIAFVVLGFVCIVYGWVGYVRTSRKLRVFENELRTTVNARTKKPKEGPKKGSFKKVKKLAPAR